MLTDDGGSGDGCTLEFPCDVALEEDVDPGDDTTYALSDSMGTGEMEVVSKGSTNRMVVACFRFCLFLFLVQ